MHFYCEKWPNKSCWLFVPWNVSQMNWCPEVWHFKSPRMSCIFPGMPFLQFAQLFSFCRKQFFHVQAVQLEHGESAQRDFSRRIPEQQAYFGRGINSALTTWCRQWCHLTWKKNAPPVPSQLSLPAQRMRHMPSTSESSLGPLSALRVFSQQQCPPCSLKGWLHLWWV